MIDTPTPPVAQVSEPPMQTSKHKSRPNLEATRVKKSWMLADDRERIYSSHTYPNTDEGKADMLTEAKRLAKLDGGKRILILQIVEVRDGRKNKVAAPIDNAVSESV